MRPRALKRKAVPTAKEVVSKSEKKTQVHSNLDQIIQYSTQYFNVDDEYDPMKPNIYEKLLEVRFQFNMRVADIY